ncbi:MAG TPA: YiiX/YebB-like N1pC/P60 family cysteine hydrolase, partial [Xanthomonadales bacterium]|nr:YiiX/YebB-like N1pC/P60 family cysteine hydrolase [Xanthomonadales bacterium]
GVVLFRDGEPFVFEAVQPVKWTPLAQWIARGEGGHYVVKRLKTAPDGLTAADAAKLRRAGRPFEGRAYDLTFEWSDGRLYCSEIVWKMYDRALGVQVGELQRLRDFDLDDPLVKTKLRERYGTNIPLDEQVVSPAAMFDSPLLVTVGSE